MARRAKLDALIKPLEDLGPSRSAFMKSLDVTPDGLENIPDDETCICLEQLDKVDNWPATLKCQHQFGAQCLLSWLRECPHVHSCPMCRAEFLMGPASVPFYDKYTDQIPLLQ